MINRRIYSLFIILTLLIVGLLIFLNNDTSEEKLAVKAFYPHASSVRLVKTVADDPFIAVNMPAVLRAYEVDGVVKAYVVSCVGYVGPIELLAAMDDHSDKILGIEVLNHKETPDYAGHIEAPWFKDRFKGQSLDRYLNLVVLDQVNPEDIVQVTGASISSQAVVNGVNAAIGAYLYSHKGIEMDPVPDVVSQDMWQQDMNSFIIRWEGGDRRINTEEIKTYSQIERDVVLVNTTGTETKMRVKGTTLNELLKAEGLDLKDFEGIGVTGRDGYYTLIDRDILSQNDVIVVWQVNDKDLKSEEKPVRIALPNALGPYWVKMVSSIDLYAQISPKDIQKVHLFEALTQDIKPYAYEYYGSQDASIEIGQILRKFEWVDEKGFFTLTSVDGLIKNETISMVRQRYYIKIAGENAPMNIGPGFKLGMNVKHIACFSTTQDAVVFPDMMQSIVRTKTINNQDGLMLEDVLLTAGMRWESSDTLVALSESGKQHKIDATRLTEFYLVTGVSGAALYDGDILVLEDISRVEKP